MNSHSSFERAEIAEDATGSHAAGESESREAGQICAPDAQRLAAAETILLVEDEAFVREVTCEVLRSAGYEVLSAKNAAEGLRAYEQCDGEIDLLLTDIVLPGETGQVLAKRLKGQNSALKVLFVTGYAEQMVLRETRQEACLAKPFSTSGLLRKVRQLLDRPELGTEEYPTMPACGNA